MIVEGTAGVVAEAKVDLAANPHVFVTTKSSDFSNETGDKRLPHRDLEAAFTADGSTYTLGFDGLESVLQDHLSETLNEFLDESDFVEDPR